MIGRGLLLLALDLVSSLPAYAAVAFLDLGFGQGGADLSPLTGGQNYALHAGDGFYFETGAVFTIIPGRPHRFELELGIGYLFKDDSQSKDDTVSFHRLPLNAIYFYRNTENLFRLGYGVTYQVDNAIEAKGKNASAATGVNNALGFILQAEKFFGLGTDSSGYLGLGVRYEKIDYRAASFATRANGDVLSLILSVRNPDAN